MTLISQNAELALMAALFSCIDTKEGVKPRKKVHLAFIFQVVMDFFYYKVPKRE